MTRLRLHFYCGLFVLILSGCVAFQPFPNVARPGDTITLAIGSVDGANRSNVTVQYFADSDPSTAIDLTTGIRSVIKIFPDKTSSAYWDSGSVAGTDSIGYLTSTLSKHGAWQSVVVLDLPLNLPAGEGDIVVSLGSEVIYPATLKKVDDVTIAMEILSDGQGSSLIGESSTFEYHETAFNNNSTLGDLSRLEHIRQAVVRVTPNFFASYIPVAAAEYDINLLIEDQSQVDVSDQVDNGDLVVVIDDQPNILKNQTNLIWSRVGSALKVIMTSPAGTQDPSNVRFSILISNRDLESNNGWSISSTSQVNSVNYYDTNGDLMSGPTPELIIQ